MNKNLQPAPVIIIEYEKREEVRRFLPLWPCVDYKTMQGDHEWHVIGTTYAVKFFKGKWWLIPIREYESTKSPASINQVRDELHMLMKVKSKLKFSHSLIMERYEPDPSKKDLAGNYIDLDANIVTGKQIGRAHV